MGPHGRVQVEFTPPSTYRVIMRGEFDDEEAETLRQTLCRLVEAADRTVEVDMADVAFIGSGGAAAVLAAFDLAVWSGSTLHVSAASPFAQRLLHVVGLDQVLGPDAGGV